MSTVRPAVPVPNIICNNSPGTPVLRLRGIGPGFPKGVSPRRAIRPSAALPQNREEPPHLLPLGSGMPAQLGGRVSVQPFSAITVWISASLNPCRRQSNAKLRGSAKPSACGQSEPKRICSVPTASFS